VTATTTTAVDILKENYTGTRLEYLTYKTRPWWGMVKKRSDFGGKYKPIPVMIANPLGGSATFSNANSNTGGANYEAFDLTRARQYQKFTIDTEALMASEGDANAFRSLVVTEAQGALNEISETISRRLFGSTSGAVGTISSGQGTATLTLTNLSDIVNFQIGDILVAGLTADGSDVTANSVTLTAVDRDAGTITAGANFHADFDDGDTLFKVGDATNGFAGLASWLPSSAPSSGESFFGVDRSVDPTRLAGIRYTATVAADTDIAGAINNAAGRVMTQGGNTDLILINPLNFTTLIAEAMAKVSLDKHMPMKGYEKLPAHLGFSGVTMATASGTAKVVADKHCPLGVVYMLQSDTWCFHSLGKAPFMFNKDGKLYDREDNADSISARYQVYGNLACSAPGYNARVDITAVD
jgi:hypothetical protein